MSQNLWNFHMTGGMWSITIKIAVYRHVISIISPLSSMFIHFHPFIHDLSPIIISGDVYIYIYKIYNYYLAILRQFPSAYIPLLISILRPCPGRPVLRQQQWREPALGLQGRNEMWQLKWKASGKLWQFCELEHYHHLS